MNQKRPWPGVPNRNSWKSSARVSRPKSNATVVVVLPATGAGSTPSLASVITSSVCTGGISEMELISVVLPTPNPPLTTIFTDAGSDGTGPVLLQLALQAVDDAQVHGRVPFPALRVRVHAQPAGPGQVVDQHPDHTERQPERGPQLGQGHVRASREVVQAAGFRVQPGDVVVVATVVRDRHDGFQQQVLVDDGPAAGDGERADPLAFPHFGCLHGSAPLSPVRHVSTG